MSRKRRLPGFAWRVLAHRYRGGACIGDGKDEDMPRFLGGDA